MCYRSQSFLCWTNILEFSIFIVVTSPPPPPLLLKLKYYYYVLRVFVLSKLYKNIDDIVYYSFFFLHVIQILKNYIYINM